MTDIQMLALLSPVALVVLVSAIVLLEELNNRRAMRRENAAAMQARAQTETYRGHMTIETGRYLVGKAFDAQAKRRIG